MKTLSSGAAAALLAFLDAFDLAATGAWQPIAQVMQDDYGIEDPEKSLEDARQELNG